MLIWLVFSLSVSFDRQWQYEVVSVMHLLAGDAYLQQLRVYARLSNVSHLVHCCFIVVNTKESFYGYWRISQISELSFRLQCLMMPGLSEDTQSHE